MPATSEALGEAMPQGKASGVEDNSLLRVRHTNPYCHCLLQKTLRYISRDQAGRHEAPFLKPMCTGKWPLCSGLLHMLTPAYRLLFESPCSFGGHLIGSSVSPWSSSTCQTQV